MFKLIKEEVQEKIDLTPEQEKAFNALIRAVKRCEKENIYFYQVLEKLGALNGHNVLAVGDDLDYSDPTNLQRLLYPVVGLTDAWADDTHFVKLKED